MKKIGLVIFLLATCVLTGCASSTSGGSQTELRTSSDQTEVQKRARIRMDLAVGYYEQRQYEVALDEIKRAIQIDPDFSDAYGVRALIYMAMGETHLAEDNFLRAIKLAPNNPDLANNYGWFLCQSGRPRESIAYFDGVLKNRAYQSPVKALNNAGMCSLKMKNDAAAEDYFVQAFKFEPANPVTNQNLAKIYYLRGDYERARFYLGRVIKNDTLNADVLWLGIKIDHKLRDFPAEASLATQLRRRYPNSTEYSAYQRGAFDE